MSEEKQLIEELQNIETRNSAFTKLVALHSQKLYYVVRRIVIYHEDANDLMQQIWIKVFQNIKNYKGESKLYTWLYRIAVNECLTHINKSKKMSTIDIEDQAKKEVLKLTSDELFDGDEAIAKLKIAISQLPDKQRMIFEMRYYDELSYDEIAKVLNQSVGGLKASYHIAYKKISSFLLNET